MSTWSDTQTETLAHELNRMAWRFKRPFPDDVSLKEYLEDIDDLDYDAVWAAIREARRKRFSMPTPAHLREYGQTWARKRAYAVSMSPQGQEAAALSDGYHCELCEDTGVAGRECQDNGDSLAGAELEPLRAFAWKPGTPTSLAQAARHYRATRCPCRDTNPRYQAKVAANTSAVSRSSGKSQYTPTN